MIFGLIVGGCRVKELSKAPPMDELGLGGPRRGAPGRAAPVRVAAFNGEVDGGRDCAAETTGGRRADLHQDAQVSSPWRPYPRLRQL